MARDIRFIPPDSLQHVVDNTYQGRFLLAPSSEVNSLLAGVLGRAQRKHDMRICAVVVASNHIHLLLRPRDGSQLASFMGFFKTNVAKEIGKRLRRWDGRFFGGRYRSTTVSTEPMAQAAVLRYVLSHGPKERLVDRVQDWPGLHSATHLMTGRPMEGLWFDRTREYRRRRAAAEEPAVREKVWFSPLPAFEHLSRRKWRLFVRGMVEEIDQTYAADRKLEGQACLGAAKVLAMDPEFRPSTRKKSPKRRFHAVDPDVLKALNDLWQQVVTAYRDAATALKQCALLPAFPEGTFPPSLPFVPFPWDTLQNPRGRPC